MGLSYRDLGILIPLCVVSVCFPSSTVEQAPKLRLTLERGDVVRSIAFSPDGKTLGVGFGAKNGSLVLLDVGTGKVVRTLPGESTVVFAFALDGRSMAVACGDGTIRLWEIASAKTRMILPGNQSEGRADALTFTPDGNILVSTGGESVTSLWDLGKGTIISTWAQRSLLDRIAYTIDAKIVAGANGGTKHPTINLWEVASGKKTASIDSDHKFGVYSLSFSPDGKILASGGRDAPAAPKKNAQRPDLASEQFRDGVVQLWDATTGKNLKTLKGHLGTIGALAFSPDGKTLASASRDTTVKLWDVGAGTNLATLRGHTRDVSCLSFSPDGKTLASGSMDKTIKLWDISPGR